MRIFPFRDPVWCRAASVGAAGERGFTLIELVVVMVILAMAYALVLPAVLSATDRGQLDRATAAVYDGLRRARGEAIASGRPVSLNARQLVSNPDIVLERRENAGTPISFYPDGSATGVELTLLLGKRSKTVGVDWLTGQVSVAR